MTKKQLFSALLAMAAMLTAPTRVQAQEAYAALSDDGNTVTFYYDTEKESRGGVDINRSFLPVEQTPAYGGATTAVFDASFANYRPTSTSYWFRNCYSLTSITGFENLKTDDVTSMAHMFSSCTALTVLDLTSFKTDNVKSMFDMFGNCTALKSLNLSSFNTENVTNMTYMFTLCPSLTSLDLSNFNTRNVKGVTAMFASSSGLTTIYVGEQWSMENVTEINGDDTFSECTSLVGGSGTTYDAAHTDYTYARVDGGAAAPGYLTAKTPTAIQSATTVDGCSSAPVHSLSGQRLTAPQRGVNIIGGRKVVVK